MADGQEVVAEASPDPKYTKSWTWPTNTWLAAQLISLAAIVGNAIDTGWSHTESKAIVAWAVAGAVAYLVPDQVRS
jgi:hypothetical protein